MEEEDRKTENRKDLSKRKNINMKTLVEAEDRRERNGMTQALVEKQREKTNKYKVGEE